MVWCESVRNGACVGRRSITSRAAGLRRRAREPSEAQRRPTPTRSSPGTFGRCWPPRRFSGRGIAKCGHACGRREFALTFACEARIAWDPFLARCERERTLRSVTAALSLMSTLLGTRDLFPRLDRCLASIAPIALPEGIATRLAACRRSTTDRLWASRIQDPSRLRAAAWWAVSLPFRIAAHRPELASRTAG